METLASLGENYERLAFPLQCDIIEWADGGYHARSYVSCRVDLVPADNSGDFSDPPSLSLFYFLVPFSALGPAWMMEPIPARSPPAGHAVSSFTVCGADTP